VIDYITSERALDETMGIAFAYYDYWASDMVEDTYIISALIKQLCRKRRHAPAGLVKVKQDALPPSSIDNRDAFVTTTNPFTEIYLVVDAPDEYPKAARPKILAFLRAVTDDLTRAKVFDTSCREGDIEKAFRRWGTPTITMKTQNVAADISRYVSDEVRRLREGQSLYISNDGLESKIVKTLDGKDRWHVSALSTT
jgi:ankyrin repeat domain-containing protein 50